MRQRHGSITRKARSRSMWERWRRAISPANCPAVGSKPLVGAGHSGAHGWDTSAQRHRSRLALTLAEREEISRAVAAGHSIRR